MKTNDCTIYEDLMTMDGDDLLQPSSKQALMDHLKSCNSCQAKYQAMHQDLVIETPELTPEIDYFKTVRKRNRRLIGFSLAGLIGLMLILTGIKLFILGQETQNFHQTVRLETVSGQPVYKVTGRLSGSAEVITRVRVIDQADATVVKVYTGLTSFFNKRTTFELTLPGDKPILIGSSYYGPDKGYASKLASDLFAAKVQYIGDNSAVIRLLATMQLDKLSPYTIELKTDQVPYRLTLRLEKELPDVELVNQRLEAYSGLILSLIENADEVGWLYQSVGQKKEVIFTRGEIDRLLSDQAPVRDFSSSAVKIQQLLDRFLIY